MTARARIEPPDLLGQTIEALRPHLDRPLPVKARIEALWAAVVAARKQAATDVIEAEFVALAHETGLFAALGRHADEDLRHVIRWGLQGKNPFR